MTSSRESLVILFFTIASIFASHPTNQQCINQKQCNINCDNAMEWSKNASLINYEKIKFQNCNFTLIKDKNLMQCILANMKNLTKLNLSSNELQNLTTESFNHNSQLENLELHGNKLKVIEPGTFDQLKKLKWLNLCFNHLTKLELGIFDQLTNLETLNLCKNNLTKLESGIFNRLVTLEILDLSSNNLVNLPNDIFAKLENLEEVFLYQNNFTDLPRNLLQNNTKLKEVRLFKNARNLTLLEGFFSNLTNLEKLTLTNNGLVTLPKDLFRNSCSLNEIALNNNYLQSLPENTFQDLKKLTTLDLNSNNLTSLPDYIFRDTSQLKILNLSNNRITSISEQLFNRLHRLENLCMEQNQLRTISGSSFDSLKNLKIVDLSHNYLTFESNSYAGYTSPFYNCSSLKELYLANNSISKIFGDWIFQLGKLRELDLSYNNITSIEAGNLMFKSDYISVNLTHNKIQHIFLQNAENISNNQKHKRKILVENNPLSCDCDIYDFLRYIQNEMHSNVKDEFQIEIGNLACHSPEKLKSRRVDDLSSQRYSRNLTCSINNTDSIIVCPEECECSLKPSDKTFIFNCSHKNLTSVPNIKEPNISTIRNFFTKSINKIEQLQLQLNFSNNQLTHMPNLTAMKLSSVNKLILSHNNISEISLDELSRWATIEVLELHNNSLFRIQPEVLQFLNNSNNLTHLTIHENQWQCDCSAINFYHFIHSKSEIIKESKPICHGKNKFTLKESDFCPIDTTMMIYISVTIALLGLITGIFGLLYYKYEEEIKIWLFAHKWCLWFVTEEELDKNKLYDAFVSFSHEDEDFIRDKLVPKLENGPTPFKLCLHYRDWLAGIEIEENIVKSVENSKRTIVVLSPNFLKSIWGIWEFRVAHCQALNERRARVILILYQDVGPINDLNAELKAYIKMNTYIQWGDPWFWDKLRYALPHQHILPKTNNAGRKIFANHQFYIQAIENKKELIYPIALPETPVTTTPPADSVKMFDDKPEEESRNYLLQKSYKLNDDIAVIHTPETIN